MATLTDLLKSVVMVTSNVEALKADVKRLNELVLEQQERIIRLEGSGDLIAEKAKNAALASAQLMNTQISRDIAELRVEIAQLKMKSPNIQISKGLLEDGIDVENENA